MLEQFVVTLDLGDIGLMVYDWGGPIGPGFAGPHPERNRALVIGHTWARPVQGTQILARISKIAGGPIGRFLILKFNVFVNLVVPSGVSRRLSPAQMRAYRGPF